MPEMVMGPPRDLPKLQTEISSVHTECGACLPAWMLKQGCIWTSRGVTHNLINTNNDTTQALLMSHLSYEGPTGFSSLSGTAMAMSAYVRAPPTRWRPPPALTAALSSSRTATAWRMRRARRAMQQMRIHALKLHGGDIA